MAHAITHNKDSSAHSSTHIINSHTISNHTISNHTSSHTYLKAMDAKYDVPGAGGSVIAGGWCRNFAEHGKVPRKMDR